MEIKGPGRIETAGVRRTARPTASADAEFRISDSGAPVPAQAVSAPATIAAVESILMLQQVDDTRSGPSRGIAHGEQLLDMLDQVRDGLLAGGISRTTLNRLAAAVGRRQENFADPKLQGILDEIDLRARVELAKLEQADARSC